MSVSESEQVTALRNPLRLRVDVRGVSGLTPRGELRVKVLGFVGGGMLTSVIGAWLLRLFGPSDGQRAARSPPRRRK
jgi:hypothetical protein